MPNYLEHLRVESSRFREALAGVDASARVPSCPDWTAADLLWHLTEVQHFWGSIVAGRLQDPDEVSDLVRPRDFGRLLDLFDERSAFLLGGLGSSEPGARVWTWSDDNTVGFVRRRQAHEALIHRADADLVTGDQGPIDPDLAADGVDEILTVMLGSLPEWGTFEPDGSSLRIGLADGSRSWGLALGQFVGTSPSSGKTYDEPAATVGLDAVEPDLAIVGSPDYLDLWLWGRGPIDRLELHGDPNLGHRLRDLIVEVTQ